MFNFGVISQNEKSMQGPNLTLICALYVSVYSDFAEKECCFQLLLMQGVDSTHMESARSC